MRGDTTDFGPIPGAAEEGPRRSRIGISRLPWWSRGRIGLLLLGLIVLPWLPISGPPSDATPARRVRGVGDTRHPGLRVRPRWRDDRDHPDGRARGPAGRGGRRGRPLLPGPPRSRPGPGVLARRPIAGRGRHRTRYPPVRRRGRRGGASPGDADPLRSRAWPSPPTAAPWPRRVTSITRSSSGTSPRGGSGRGCGATDPP